MEERKRKKARKSAMSGREMNKGRREIRENEERMKTGRKQIR